MHQTLKIYPCGIKQQYGTTLVLSLLLLGVLTILSMTVIQGSYLGFKTQSSRIASQNNFSSLEGYQAQAAKKIKAFIDSRVSRRIEQSEQHSEGFSVLDRVLSFNPINEDQIQQLTPILDYSTSDMEVSVYISRSRLNEVNAGSVHQHTDYNAYSTFISSEKIYLFLRMHCIARPRFAQNVASIQIISDFRFEV